MEKANRKKFNVVVVDDSDYARKHIIEILEEEGFNVAGQAANAEDALKIHATVPCHLFLIDVVMPMVSGLELAKFLTEKKTQASIIMMSSLGIESVVIESISNGAVDFLKKPFERHDLVSSVDKVATYMETEKLLT